MTEQLRSIIAKHRHDYDQRTYDYALRGEPIRLARGSPEHAAAFRRRPQWHAHLSHVARGGLPVTYLAAITSEATQTLGRDAAAAVEDLL